MKPQLLVNGSLKKAFEKIKTFEFKLREAI